MRQSKTEALCKHRTERRPNSTHLLSSAPCHPLGGPTTCLAPTLTLGPLPRSNPRGRDTLLRWLAYTRRARRQSIQPKGALRNGNGAHVDKLQGPPSERHACGTPGKNRTCTHERGRSACIAPSSPRAGIACIVSRPIDRAGFGRSIAACGGGPPQNFLCMCPQDGLHTRRCHAQRVELGNLLLDDILSFVGPVRRRDPPLDEHGLPMAHLGALDGRLSRVKARPCSVPQMQGRQRQSKQRD